ncbi:MAG TPA: thermonuclease family protein [Planctomycetaceae bacterium]|nr:thermonuclease family protein [Planctomycetaceae bacterium]
MIARGRPSISPRARRPRFAVGFPTRSVWALVILCLLVAGRFRQPSAHPSPDFRFEADAVRHVERVIDGDTIVLDGNVRVRLIGVDTPETKHPHKPVEPLGPEATEFTRSLVEGRDVTLAFDRERRDRYGRVLAYVYFDGKLLNEEIIRAGFSRAETHFKFDRAMARRFQQAEDEAREARRGIWSLAAAAH